MTISCADCGSGSRPSRRYSWFSPVSVSDSETKAPTPALSSPSRSGGPVSRSALRHPERWGFPRSRPEARAGRGSRRQRHRQSGFPRSTGRASRAGQVGPVAKDQRHQPRLQNQRNGGTCAQSRRRSRRTLRRKGEITTTPRMQLSSPRSRFPRRSDHRQSGSRGRRCRGSRRCG